MRQPAYAEPGGVVSPATVVNVQVKLAAIAFPAASCAAVVMVAVYWVLLARLTDGVNVAAVVGVLPLTFTLPATAAPPVVSTSLKLAVVSVEFLIASEKTADIGDVNATPLAPLNGETANTVGGVVSGTGAVVKFQT